MERTFFRSCVIVALILIALDCLVGLAGMSGVRRGRTEYQHGAEDADIYWQCKNARPPYTWTMQAESHPREQRPAPSFETDADRCQWVDQVELLQKSWEANHFHEIKK